MASHAYPRARYLTGILGQDVVLVLALLLLPLLPPPAPLAVALAIAIPAVLAWGLVTLHYPSRVEIDERGIAFHRYGRAHRFAWSEIEQVRVRRFLVKDRVMLRIVPAAAWRGRYWILDSIDGFDALLHEVQQRARTM